MNGRNLLIGLCYIDPKFIAESENDGIAHSRGVFEKTGQGGTSLRKYLLIAAVIGLLALTITACAVVYSRIRMKVVQHNPAVTTSIPESEEWETKATPVDILTQCYPQTLPEGYKILSGAPTDYNTRSICYQNDEGSIIHFSISTQRDSDDVVLKPPVTEKTLEIFGQTATLVTNEDGAQLLRWHNKDGGYYAVLLTEDSHADLVSMMQSITPGETLPLSFLYNRGRQWDIWYPQTLPEGYSCSNVSPIGGGSQTIRYEGDGGNISYHISVTEPFTVSDPPQDSAVWEDTSVGGQPARKMTASSGVQILLWENVPEGFYAMLDTDNGSVDLIAMAESVAPGEKLEVSAHYLGPDYTIELEQEPSEYVGWESIYPQEVPKGYSISFISDPAYGQQDICYENADGNTISFTLYFRLGQWGKQFDGMGQPEQVNINGHRGYQIENQLIWTDEKNGLGFALASSDDLYLLPIAQSVAPGPELTPTNADKTVQALEQLGDYQISTLPKGMVEIGLTGWPKEKSSDWYAYVRRWYVDPSTNHEIYFEYESYITDPNDGFSVEDLLPMRLGGERELLQAVTINGCTGASLQNNADASVVWLIGDATQGTEFKLYSKDYSAEELVEIAQSIRKQP